MRGRASARLMKGAFPPPRGPSRPPVSRPAGRARPPREHNETRRGAVGLITRTGFSGRFSFRVENTSIYLHRDLGRISGALGINHLEEHLKTRWNHG